jgi:hypothetical protein
VPEENVKALNGNFITPGDMIQMYAEVDQVVTH